MGSSIRSIKSRFMLAIILGSTALLGCKSSQFEANSLSSFDDVIGSAGNRVTKLHDLLFNGDITVEALSAYYLKRIDRFNKKGPALNAVIVINPKALADAQALDALPIENPARRDPLWGIPVLIKDNIETLDPMATTAGSFALAANFSQRDAALVANLRQRGAIILGKANMSEWAGLRGESGWSAVGGQTKNPYGAHLKSFGSSSGSAVGVAAGFAPLAVGTETYGSIIMPSAVNKVVGIRPANGLVSQKGIVPLVPELDTAGAIGTSVEDAVLLLEAMAIPSRRLSWRGSLKAGSLVNKRIGYFTDHSRVNIPGLASRWQTVVKEFSEGGAKMVALKRLNASPACNVGGFIGNSFRKQINAYLSSLQASAPVQSFAELVSFNADIPLEKISPGDLDLPQEESERPTADEEAKAAFALCRQESDEIFQQMKKLGLDALIEPSYGDGAGWGSFQGTSYMTVQTGNINESEPSGVVILVPPEKEDTMIAVAYGYELQTKGRYQFPPILR